MTAETDLLPLPEWYEACGPIVKRDMRAYARANVLHHTAAQAAEIEALRAEVARLRRSLHEAVVHGNRQSGRAERLAEALRSILYYIEEGGYGFEHTCERVARAALHHTAAQEGK